MDDLPGRQPAPAAVTRRLRVWTRPEIATTVVRLARTVMPHQGRCPCGRCTRVRSARAVIQQAAEPAGHATDPNPTEETPT